MTKIIRLTPPGRGAVAVMLLQGHAALDLLSRYWIGSKLRVENRPFFGRFRLDSIGQSEEVIVHIVVADEIEIHSHGGEAVVTAIETLFIQEGVESVSWQDFFCSGNTQKDFALRLLPFAPTERTARILLDQLDGALDRELTEIEQLTDPVEQQRRQKRLQENAEFGKHLVEPFRVVLAGASNAGKSSLFNAILGFQRSIVDAVAGTTRDVVSSQTALDGFPVTFYDTAGLRETQHDLELQGMERSLQSLADADLIVWVVDLAVPEAERTICPVAEKTLLCFNKIDLVKQNVSDNAVYVSATTGEGIEILLERIIRRLVPNPPEAFEGVLLNDSASLF